MKVGQRIVEVIFKGVDNTSGAFSGFQKQVGELGKKMPILAGAFDLLKNPIAIATTALIAMANGIKKVVTESIDAAARMQDMSDRTGVAATELSKYEYIASQTGTTVEDFEGAITKLRRAILNAAQDSKGDAAAAFSELGVSVTDAEGKMRPAEEVLMDISAAIQGLDADSPRAVRAMDLMGRGSQGFISTLRLGPDALRAITNEAEATGGAVSESLAKASDDAKDSAETLKLAWRGFFSGWSQGWAEYQTYWNTGLAAILAGLQGKGDEFRRAQLEKEAAALNAQHLKEQNEIKQANEKKERLEKEHQDRLSLIKVAARYGVAVRERSVLPSGSIINIDRTSEAIQKDIDAAIQKGLDSSRGDSEKRKKAYDDFFSEMDAERAMAVYKMAPITVEAPIKFKALADPLAAAAAVDMSALNDAFEMPALKDYQQEMIDAGKATMYMAAHLRDVTISGDQTDAQLTALAEAMKEFAATPGMDPEVLAAVLEYYRQLNVELGRRKKKVDENTKAEEDLKAIGESLKSNLEEIGVTAVDAFLNGEAGAMKFGDMIRRTITRAIAEAIVKLIVMKAIAAMTNNIIGAKDGGAVAGKRAFGGRIPGYAGGGYAVPDGPRGMDSRLIMAMPGEEVINRQLSMRLDRMVTSFEMGAAVSPFALSGAGGGRSTVINFNVARPVNVLDALSLGKDAVTASRKYSEALL